MDCCGGGKNGEKRCDGEKYGENCCDGGKNGETCCGGGTYGENCGDGDTVSIERTIVIEGWTKLSYYREIWRDLFLAMDDRREDHGQVSSRSVDKEMHGK